MLEDISAENDSATSSINFSNNDIVVKVKIDQFDFPNKLMQEHFNKNYIESERFPYANFKGKIDQFIDFTKPGIYQVTAQGKLNIHGVERSRLLKGKLTVINGKMILDAVFNIVLEEHKIKIPEIAFNKIAEVIEVNNHFEYKLSTN